MLPATFVATVRSQDTVTGAFEGTVTSSENGAVVAGAAVEIINQQTGIVIPKRTDSRGRFYQGLLQPGLYIVRVSATGFRTREVVQRLFITRTGEVVPVPVSLDPVTAGAPPTTPLPGASPTPAPPIAPVAAGEQETDIRAKINATDARRDGAFSETEVSTLPLGATTLTRSFDELATLLPGVAPPPQTLGSVAGPGVGAGVGTAGQFAVNGLRSRGNNFTVDGSDNNDEDIGVRRQGFVALNSQPIESVREYQVITLLAPAQFGRNIGAQVNAVSKSGGDEVHGEAYGFFNSSQLNARNHFDTTNGNNVFPLRANGREVLIQTRDSSGAVTGQRPLTARNQSGGEDSFTFGQAGFVVGGPIRRQRLFYFVAAEGQIINAMKEESFAVPTVEQRGAFRAGATGLFRNPFDGVPVSAIPGSIGGSAIFNLFPFPNNPDGVYGQNTFTQTLPAGGRGVIWSARIDGNFTIGGKPQSIAERYNYTEDSRIIPATGGAVFSSLKPRVRTQNSSLYFNSQLSAPDARRQVFNQARLSYGRTRLIFAEARDQSFLTPSRALPNAPFLLNAPLMLNVTRPTASGVANSGPAIFLDPLSSGRFQISTVEDELGLLGQVLVAGFSPVGVDVLNFPQRRVNNTYQFADQLTVRSGNHSFVFGSDNRRTELNSDLPRNARPLVTFNGAPRLVQENGAFRFPLAGEPNPIIRPEDLAAFGAASNFFLTLNVGGNDANINLRFYQLNFYGQDTWRARRNLSLSYGLRYERNTPPREVNGRIENTFDDPALGLAPGLRQFIDGRARIYDADRDNFGPRVGVAYAPNPFGAERVTVFRAGFGIFYDQILGAVVSQSRNVFPRFVTLNFGGLNPSFEDFLIFSNPSRTELPISSARVGPIRMPGSLNTLNPELSLSRLLAVISFDSPSALSATLPARRLETPAAYHYAFTAEQQLNAQTVASVAYVGTQGRHLLRFTTPNLGPGLTIAPTSLVIFQDNVPIPNLPIPAFRGQGIIPARRVNSVGAINIFETTANSRYDALQLQVRGRLKKSLLYQAAYTFSKATDDVSDVFDLAGAAALPQNSLTFAGERGSANFDVRHRFTYNFIYSFAASGGSPASRLFLKGLQLAGTGRLRTGQPFTVNSIIDVNLDGNLTDRLDNTDGIVVTGDRSRPLRLTMDNPSGLLAPFGQDGMVGRNTFRAGAIMEFDLALHKKFIISGRQNLIFRADIFNLFNRANFGIPVRFLEAPGFGQATNTVTPGRRVQLALKYSF